MATSPDIVRIMFHSVISPWVCVCVSVCAYLFGLCVWDFIQSLEEVIDVLS